MTHIKGGTTDEARPHHEPHEALTPSDLSNKRSERRPRVSCILTQEPLNEDKDNLIRFVKAPDGAFIADLKQKLPAEESFYIKADRETLSLAFGKGLFQESYASLDILTDHIISLLETSFYQLIALARRSGDVIFGFEKIQELIQRNKAVFVLAAPSKTQNSTFKALPDNAYCVFGDAERYGQIFSRERVVYIAFTKPHFVKDIKNLIKRMEHLRIQSNHAIPQD